jgi:uncharacterized membrane protein YbjE (DUF340 family)
MMPDEQAEVATEATQPFVAFRDSCQAANKSKQTDVIKRKCTIESSGRSVIVYVLIELMMGVENNNLISHAYLCLQFSLVGLSPFVLGTFVNNTGQRQETRIDGKPMRSLRTNDRILTYAGYTVRRRCFHLMT